MIARKVFFAVASHFAANDTAFVNSLVELAQAKPCPIVFGFSFDPSVERARNGLTDHFLKSDCTHLLFCDADISFTPDQVDRITSHDVEIVGGLYPIKNFEDPVRWCANRCRGETPDRPDGLLEVEHVGTGFMCIKREVFFRIISKLGDRLIYIPAGEPDGSPKRQHAFWRQGVHGNRFLTEDYMFCQTWRSLDGKIFADTRVMLTHAGRAEWPLPWQLSK